jgi:hypothetical protein
MAEQNQVPIHQFDHKERKDDVANRIRGQRGVRDGMVLIGVAQDKLAVKANKSFGKSGARLRHHHRVPRRYSCAHEHHSDYGANIQCGSALALNGAVTMDTNDVSTRD